MLLLFWGAEDAGDEITPPLIAASSQVFAPTVALDIAPPRIRRNVLDAYFDVDGIDASSPNDSYFTTTIGALSGIDNTLRVISHAALPDYSPPSSLEPTIGWGWQSNQFNVVLRSDGKLQMNTAGVTDGVSGASATRSNAAIPALTDGDGYWWLIDCDFVGGTVGFFYSADPPTIDIDDISWSQIGTDVAVTGAPSGGATDARFGDAGTDGNGYFDGQLRRGRIEADGVLEVDIDFRYQEDGDITFVDLVGKTWTRNSGATNPASITVLDPVYEPGVTLGLAPDRIESTAEVFTPAIGQVIRTEPLAGSAIIFSPTLTESDVNEILPDRIESTAQVFAPAMVTLHVDPPAIAPSSQVFAPTVAQDIDPTAIAPSSQVFAPAMVTLHIDPPAIASGSQVFEPTVASNAQDIAPPVIASTAVVFAPHVSQDIDPPNIETTAVVYQPTVTLDIDPPLVGPSSQVFAPSLTSGIVVPLVPAGSQVFAPAVELILHPTAIAPTSQVFAPALTLGILVPFPTPGAQVFAPSITLDILVPFLASGSQVFTPGLVATLQEIIAQTVGFEAATQIIELIGATQVVGLEAAAQTTEIDESLLVEAD